MTINSKLEVLSTYFKGYLQIFKMINKIITLKDKT